MQRHALIGHTGFVGSNLRLQRDWQATFNSQNFAELRGQRYDEVWCAGIQAAKWWANANPDDDLARIENLLDVFDTLQTERFVLVSTVDVYGNPICVDESCAPEPGHAYGRNRLRAEQFVRSRFPHATIVRLPGLYGKFLKKNAIYDLLVDNRIDAIDSESVFQFYDLARLADDVETAATNAFPLAHLVTAPVKMADVARAVLGREFVNRCVATPARYDVRTRYASAFGGNDGYLADAAAVLEGIARFATDWRRA